MTKGQRNRQNMLAKTAGFSSDRSPITGVKNVVLLLLLLLLLPL